MKTLFYVLTLMIMSSITTLAEEKNVIILGTNHVPPFKIIEGQTLKGINADVLKEIFRDMNLELKIKNCPWKRCLVDLKEGKIDVFLGLYKSPEREKVYHFCEPSYKDYSTKAFYLKKGQGHNIKKYEDLYKLQNIGVTRGYSNFKQFDNDTKLKKIFVTDHLQNVQKLVFGRLDAIIQTEIAADYLIKTNGFADKVEKAEYKYAKVRPSYFAVSKKSPYMKRINEFEKNLERLVKEDAYKKIADKWTQ